MKRLMPWAAGLVAASLLFVPFAYALLEQAARIVA